MKIAWYIYAKIVRVIIEKDRVPHCRYYFINPDTNYMLKDTIEIHFLQLRLFECYNGNKELRDWMEFIRFKDREEVFRVAKSNPHIEKAVKELEKISSNPEQREAYEAREKELRDMVNQLNDSYEQGAKNTAIEMAEELFVDGCSLDAVYSKKSITKNLSYEEVVLIEKRIKKEL